MSALFLRHEGFLGAVGAFLKVHPMHVPTGSSAAAMAAAVAATAGLDGPGGAAAAAGRPGLQASDRNASTKVGLCGFEGFALFVKLGRQANMSTDGIARRWCVYMCVYVFGCVHALVEPGRSS